MVVIIVDGDHCSIQRRGKVSEVSQDYLKVIMSLIESLSKDADVSRQDILTYLYDMLTDIYDDGTEIETL